MDNHEAISFPAEQQLFAGLVDYVRELVGSSAVLVQRDDPLQVSVQPGNPNAASLWIALVGALVVQTGRGGPGGRWELDFEDADELQLARGIIEAVVKGRVEERIGWARSTVTVTLDDGSTTYEVGRNGIRGIILQPGWMSRNAPRRYEAFR